MLLGIALQTIAEMTTLMNNTMEETEMHFICFLVHHIPVHQKCIL